MNKGFLGIALAAHELWLRDDSRGAKADLRWADLSGADLRWADLSEANLRRADLSGANLSRANLRWANLRWANLSRADLSGADLSGANLSRANLSGANLSGANLSGANRIIGPQRSDGYLFTYCTETRSVFAGCRKMTVGEYRLHCANYGDESKRRETMAILDCLELLAAARGDTVEDGK